MADINSHKRVNDILLGPLERPVLRWLAAHMPAGVTPDALTTIGVLGAAVVSVGYVLCRWHPAFLWLASLGLLIHWFGDSLDGTLARHRHIERPRYGFFLDHTVDAFTEMLMFLGGGLSPFVRFDVACLSLIGYLMVSVVVYVNTGVRGTFQISYGKIGPTEVRAIAILTNTGIFFGGNPGFRTPVGPLTVADLIVAAGGAYLFSAYVTTTLRGIVRLRREEPRPAGGIPAP